MDRYEVLTATFSAAGTVSSVIQPQGNMPFAIQMPAGTAWNAAGIGFQASMDNVTYAPVYDDLGVEKAVVTAAARTVYLDSTQFAGFPFIKLVSGTWAVPVAQDAARSVKVMVLVSG